MSVTKRVQRSIVKIIQRVASSLFALLMLVSCGNDYAEVKSKRSATIDKSDVINVAVIWDKEVTDFLLVEGIMQAADEINERGVFGRKIKIKVFYSKNGVDELNLARKVAKDTSFTAVIGHRISENAIPASIIYEYSGLLFIAPSAANDNITNHGFGYTFRTSQSVDQVSDEIADFMKSQGHKLVAVIDDRSVYGKGLADNVMDSLADVGVITVVRRHYTPGQTDFKPLCAELVRHNFDALFIGGEVPSAGEFIREARQMGIRQRVYGGDGMDSRALERVAGNAANGTVVPTSFNLDLDNAVTQEFVKSFRKRYGKPPDTSAALGYDSLKILAEAIKRSKSANPSVVASNMRFIKDWQGVTGAYTFNVKGDLVDKISYFKYLNQTRFIYFGAPEKGEDSDKSKD